MRCRNLLERGEKLQILHKRVDQRLRYAEKGNSAIILSERSTIKGRGLLPASGDMGDWPTSRNVGSDISPNEARFPQYLRKSFPTISPELGLDSIYVARHVSRTSLQFEARYFHSIEITTTSHSDRRANHPSNVTIRITVPQQDLSIPSHTMSLEARTPDISQVERHGYLFGHPIAHSMSPLLHQTVYDNMGLDWSQIPLDSKDMNLFLELIKHPKFYGKSVLTVGKDANL
jgi:hypothetical protein